MVFVAPEKESTKDIKNKLKVAYEGLDNKLSLHLYALANALKRS